MLDFTSALYLGLRHPSWSLAPWDQLTTGRPAALMEAPSHAALAAALAELVGCERATLGSSTLHLFWDLFGMLDTRYAIYMDAGVYPVARWGVERAAARRIPVKTFAHHNVDALRRAMQDSAGRRLQPVVVADGFCPACGQPAPIAAYLEIIQSTGGLLVLDDTQAVGVLGHSPCAETPLGFGGGGSLRLHNVAAPNVVLINSLSKAFGAPMTMFAGTDAMVRTFEAKSETRVHTSPPSCAAIHAGRRALAVNQACGDQLRQRLTRLLRHFHKRLANVGLRAIGGLFPVQTLRLSPRIDPAATHERLLQSGVRTVAQHVRNGRGARVTLLITARHTPADIDLAVAALSAATRIEQSPAIWRSP